MARAIPFGIVCFIVYLGINSPSPRVSFSVASPNNTSVTISGPARYKDDVALRFSKLYELAGKAQATVRRNTTGSSPIDRVIANSASAHLVEILSEMRQLIDELQSYDEQLDNIATALSGYRAFVAEFS